MKRKYYMRGLGIGILVTAILCAVVMPKDKSGMTDEEVIARAKALGYVKEKEGVTSDDINKIKENGTPTPEASVTPELSPSGTPGPTISPTPTPEAPNPPDQPEQPEKPTPKPTNTPKPKPTSTPKPTATNTPKPTATKAPTATPVPTATKAPAEGAVKSYTVKIERGMTASSVSKLLESAGAVDSATEFVRYLRNADLTDEINIGTFTIPAEATYEEIGRLLTEIR